ncbi:MAG TPA: hypothetical protein PKH07_17255, partial [bacterium]|nr:hypothetical protein [bacterium]
MTQTPETISYFPKVVPADRLSTIRVAVLEPSPPFDSSDSYEVAAYPMEETAGQLHAESKKAVKTWCADGSLFLSHEFISEQEHLLKIEKISACGRQPIGEIRIYSLSKDLYALRPFKGDFHMHSSQSDGKEPPAHVAAACRRIGLDFMALTDHRKHAPSLEAIAAFESVPLDIMMFPGEEVHSPGNRVHIINFGGRFGITPFFADEEAFRALVQQRGRKLKNKLEPREKEQYAASVWCYDKIREAGGLAIFCHPYWVERERYNVSEPLIAQHFEDCLFDAYEVIGGFHRHQIESNCLQVARYHEERAKGKKIPIVGVSDAHGCESGELFGWYYTVLFAECLQLPDIVRSVKSLQSVAVEALPGEAP